MLNHIYITFPSKILTLVIWYQLILSTFLIPHWGQYGIAAKYWWLYFQMHFFKAKLSYFDGISPRFVPPRGQMTIIHHWFNTGLALNRWQAITWTYDGPIHWCIYMESGLNVLTYQHLYLVCHNSSHYNNFSLKKGMSWSIMHVALNMAVNA